MPQMDMKRFADIMQRLKGDQDQVLEEAAHMIRSGNAGVPPEKAKAMIGIMLPSLEPEQRRRLQKLMKLL